MEALVVFAAMLVAVVCSGLAALLWARSWGEVRRAAESAARNRAHIERAVLAFVESSPGARHDAETGTRRVVRLVVLDAWRRRDAQPPSRRAELVTTGESVPSVEREIERVSR